MKLSTEGFGWHFSKRATIWIVIIGIWIGSSILYQHAQNNQLTPESVAATNRNGFISGCTSDAAKYPSINMSAFCGCAYDKLLTLYPDFATNNDRLNRILKTGYNQTETDLVVPCASL